MLVGSLLLLRNSFPNRNRPRPRNSFGALIIPWYNGNTALSWCTNVGVNDPKSRIDQGQGER
jgi:hypothetical protein